jgi:hypothetical protein
MKEVTDAVIKTRLSTIFSENTIYYKDESLRSLIDKLPVWSNLDHFKSGNIIFAGINPSYNGEPIFLGGYDVSMAIQDRKGHYGQFSKTMLSADQSAKWTTLDLFYYREGDQTIVNRLMKSELGLAFLCEQLKLTQEILEVLKPAIIVVSNASAKRFFGINKNKEETKDVWMGYNFESVDPENNVYKITGLSEKSISFKTLSTTALIGTFVIFSRSFLYMPDKIRTQLVATLRSLILKLK